MADSFTGTIAGLFKINNSLFHKAIDGVSSEDLRKRPGDDSNPMLWIAGHMTFARTGVTRIAGGRVESPEWIEMFKRGGALEDLSRYPPIEEIVGAWDNVSGILMSRLAELDETELAKKCPIAIPIEDTSVRGGIAFLCSHESYHVGQLAYVRKWLGHSQLVG